MEHAVGSVKPVESKIGSLVDIQQKKTLKINRKGLVHQFARI